VLYFNRAKHSLIKDLPTLEPVVKPHHSVKDLAVSYEMDPVVLQQTIDEYNLGVNAKEDKFGRALREDLDPIVEPPIYATRLWPKVHF
jgi:hypothetical protein